MRDRDTLENELLQLRSVVDAFDGSMRRLATGDIHQQIVQPLPLGYDGMRKDFNRGLASVSASIDTILDRSRAVQLESAEVRQTLKTTSEEQAARAAALAALSVEAGSTADAARSQSAHVAHIANILHNARLDMRHPREAASLAVERSERTCQSMAELKSLTEEVRALLKDTALLALNGGINAVHSGPDGGEALDLAKNLHTLTQRVGATVEAIAAVAEAAEADAQAASEASGRVTRELGALGLYTDALDSQIEALGERVQVQAEASERVRVRLQEIARERRPLDDASLSPDLQLSTIERAVAEIERLAGRFTPVRVVTPPPAPQPGGIRRAHLRLIKS